MPVRIWTASQSAAVHEERAFWPSAPAVLPRVSVIVACYGQLSYTQGLVKSLQEHAGCPYDLVLVSNGCAETTQWAKRNDLQVIAFPENRGVPAAYNAGVKASSGEIIALFNNDMIVHPHGLQRLAAATYIRGMAAQTGNSWNQAGDYLGCTGDPRWMDVPEGYALAFQREVWTKTGEWDETFFPSYCDDADWALRARLAGYDAVLEPHCVEHFGQKTSAGMNLNPTIKRHQDLIRERYLNLGLGQRTLVIRWAASGDILMTTPILRALKREQPLGRLHVYTHPQAGKVLAGNRYVDARVEGGIDPKNYSRIVDLTGAYEVPQRTQTWEHPVKAYCARAGVEFDGQPYDFHLTEAHRDQAGKLLAWEPGTLVAAGLRSGTRDKQNWDAKRWLELAEALPPSIRLVALDSAPQPPLGSKGASADDARFYRHPRVLDLTGSTRDLHEAAALIEHCHGFVGVDSGLLHIAAAFAKPIVNVCAAAPMSARLPLAGKAVGFEGEAPCFPCQYRDQCPETHCLDWVSGAWVAAKIAELTPQADAPVLRRRATSPVAQKSRSCFQRA